MNRTIVDVTQLAHWQGKPTGIPRVMNQLAIRFYKKNNNTVFVVWVKELKEFCEIDYKQTIAHRGQRIFYIDNIENTEPSQTSAGIEVMGIAPELKVKFKKDAKKVIKSGLNKFAHMSPRLSQTIETRMRVMQMKKYKKVTFTQGDTLFIPWGEWWDANFIEILQKWHQQTSLKIIQIIHDMGPIVVPQFSGSGRAAETFPIYCRKILPICYLVLAVSQNTKIEIVKWLRQNNLKLPRVEVFREGDNFESIKEMKPLDSLFDKSGLKGSDFILCVGTVEAKKNHMLLYLTYKLAVKRNISLPKIVIAGRIGWKTANIVDLISEDPETKDKFVLLHNISDEELAWLYTHCMFTIITSLYEGWGMPIAESVARGVPCLCSNTTSMVEVAKGYVEHFTPTSSDECLTGIEKWLDPLELEGARKHVKKYKMFSWDDSFDQITKLMEELR